MKRAGRVPARLLDLGLPMGGLMLLGTVGRRSNIERTVPIAVLRHDGRRWLVSPFGEVGWVRNVRVNGRASLRRGRRVTPIEVIEVADDRVPAVLRRYRRSYRAVPFVRAAFTETPSSSLADFAREMHRHPVFLIAPHR